eukprot:CAMPEP_0118909166 /NCGR_PEP_ID=MMETSP1166-20130328/11860_1 /TAXON_ID=1104430 /ORGANISM="Chrysoreinhardia sp, Strain CCMP3193" /LENGTH=523 /DNA_ID=CAMNT_0006848579 /DNA_START=18 /DNA_END=1589 /DNA_ORIENTATION=+
MGQSPSLPTRPLPDYEIEEPPPEDEGRPLLGSSQSSQQSIAEAARANVLIYMFVIQFGTGLFGSLRAVYTDQVLHARDPVATATYALVGYFSFHALAMPVLGKLSDGVGRKPLAVLGVTTQAAVFATTASTVTPLVFVAAFCLLGILDASYTMMQLALVDTSTARLTGPVFRALQAHTKFEDPEESSSSSSDDTKLVERRIGALFSVAWLVGLIGSVCGVGFATLGSDYVGIRASLLIVVGCLLLLDVQLSVSLPETVDEKKRALSSSMVDAFADQAAGFRVLFATARRRTLILASFLEHAAASGGLSLIMYWLVFKFGFGVSMQAVVSVVALVTIFASLVALQGYAIEVADTSERACAFLIAASLPFWGVLGVATTPLMALLGVPAVGAVAVFPEFRALLTADLDRKEQGFAQGAITSLNAIADISGSVALLVAFEQTVDDDVPHDSHRSHFSYKANVIWHAIAAAQLVVILILLSVPPPAASNSSSSGGLAAAAETPDDEEQYQKKLAKKKQPSYYYQSST